MQKRRNGVSCGGEGALAFKQDQDIDIRIGEELPPAVSANGQYRRASLRQTILRGGGYDAVDPFGALRKHERGAADGAEMDDRRRRRRECSFDC